MFVEGKLCSLKYRRARGVSLVEALLMTIICSIAIVALLMTSASASLLSFSVKDNITAHMITANWFEMFETYGTNAITVSFDATIESVAKRLDSSYKKSGEDYMVHGYKVLASRDIDNVSRFVTVRLEILPPGGFKGDTYKASKCFNLISNETVDYSWSNEL